MLHLPPRYQRPTGVNAPADFADYKTTSLRHPKQPLKLLPQRLTELTGRYSAKIASAPAKTT